ncbi:MAG TPA: hypothetical protein VE422_24055 [Terriglobia bacterium]|nr:hypothetical protein [Terriglobia bacterium]
MTAGNDRYEGKENRRIDGDIRYIRRNDRYALGNDRDIDGNDR